MSFNRNDGDDDDKPAKRENLYKAEERKSHVTETDKAGRLLPKKPYPPPLPARAPSAPVAPAAQTPPATPARMLSVPAALTLRPGERSPLRVGEISYVIQIDKDGVPQIARAPEPAAPVQTPNPNSRT